MYFCLNYDNGYIVSVIHYTNSGITCDNLCKFFSQGEAMLFRDINCPKLTDTQIKLFIKNYNSNTIYKRRFNGKLERYELIKQLSLF